MRYIEAPTEYVPEDSDGPVIYLAGGITHCPNWQRDVAEMLSTYDVVVLNPRREAFETSWEGARQQIDWEYRHLWLEQTLTLFWFPPSQANQTVQPIALYELGAAATHWRMFVVGAHPDYPRRFDVVQQLAHARPEIEVHENLDVTVLEALSLVGNPF